MTTVLEDDQYGGRIVHGMLRTVAAVRDLNLCSTIDNARLFRKGSITEPQLFGYGALVAKRRTEQPIGRRQLQRVSGRQRDG